MISLWTAPTANSQKVTVLLELLELRYELIWVDLAAGEHLAPDFLGINPVGRVPVIAEPDLDQPLYGTLAISQYLAEKTGRLMPKGLPKRARVQQWAAILASDLSPALSGQYYFSTLYPTTDASVVDLFVQTSHRLLEVMDRQLASSDFLAGDALSIADTLGYPVAANSVQRLDGGLSGYDHIRRWCDALSGMSAVQRGMAAGLGQSEDQAAS